MNRRLPPPVPQAEEAVEDEDDIFDDEDENYENGLGLQSDGDEEEYPGMVIETTSVSNKMSVKGGMAGRAVPPVPPPANQTSAPPRPPPSRTVAPPPRAVVPEPVVNGGRRPVPPVHIQPFVESDEEELYSECPEVDPPVVEEEEYLVPSSPPKPTHAWGQRPAPPTPQSQPVGRSDSQRSNHGAPNLPLPRFNANGPSARQQVVEPAEEENYCAIDESPQPVPPSRKPAFPESRPPPVGASRGLRNLPPPPQPPVSCEDEYETSEDIAPKTAVRLPLAKQPPKMPVAGGVTGGKGEQRVVAPPPVLQQSSAEDDQEEYEELDTIQAIARRGGEMQRQQSESEVEYEIAEDVHPQPTPLPPRPGARAAPTLPPGFKSMALPPTAPRINNRVPVPLPQPQSELQVEEEYEVPQQFPSQPPLLKGRKPAPTQESVYEIEENDDEMMYECPDEARDVTPGGFKPNGFAVAPPGVANIPAKSVQLMPAGFTSVALRNAAGGLKKVGMPKLFGNKTPQLPEVSPQNQEPIGLPQLRKISTPQSEPEPAPQPAVIQPQLRKISAPRPDPPATEQPPVVQLKPSKFSLYEVGSKPVTAETSPQDSGVDPSTMSFQERQKLMQQSAIGGNKPTGNTTGVSNSNNSGTLKSGDSFSNGRRPSVESSEGSGGTFVPSLRPSDTCTPPPVMNRGGVTGKGTPLPAKAPVPTPVVEAKKNVTPSSFPSRAPLPAPSPVTQLKTPVTTPVKRQLSGASNRALPPTPQEETTSSILQSDDIRVQSWYFGGFTRQEMDALIKEQNKSGMFAVRDNSSGGNTPYTLVVYYNNKVWNLVIRRRDDQTYALGTPKADEMSFRGAVDMINYFRTHEVTLAGNGGGVTQLLYSPARRT